MNLTADAVVVGAGVIGSSIALELAKDGLSVLVVDAGGAPGHGSTSASSAAIRFNYSTFDTIATSWEAKHCWEKWADHLGGIDEAGMARFHRVGMVFLDVDIAPMGHVLEHFDEIGIPYETWDAEELARRVPGIDAGRYWPPRRLEDPEFWEDTDRTLGALWTPDAGFVDDPSLAAQNLANAARRRGTEFRFRRTVTEVLGAGSGTVSGVVLDDGTRIDAPVVVSATGPWSGQLNALAGVGEGWTVATRPMRQEVHHVSPPPGYNDTENGIGPCVADLDLGTYMRGTPGDGFLVGGTEPECEPLEWVERPEDAAVGVTQRLFEAQVTRAARRFPDLGVPLRPLGVSGVYDVTPDWTPIYDRTELDGFFVAIGTSGNQFKNAPVVGRIMSALVQGSNTLVGEHTGHEIDLAAFSRTRSRNAASTGTVMG